jgi:hypothetical protein
MKSNREVLTALGIETLPPGVDPEITVRKFLADAFFCNRTVEFLVREYAGSVFADLKPFEQAQLLRKLLPPSKPVVTVLQPFGGEKSERPAAAPKPAPAANPVPAFVPARWGIGKVQLSGLPFISGRCGKCSQSIVYEGKVEGVARIKFWHCGQGETVPPEVGAEYCRLKTN